MHYEPGWIVAVETSADYLECVVVVVDGYTQKSHALLFSCNHYRIISFENYELHAHSLCTHNTVPFDPVLRQVQSHQSSGLEELLIT